MNMSLNRYRMGVHMLVLAYPSRKEAQIPSESRAPRPNGKQRANVKRVTAKFKASHGPILSMPNAEQVQQIIGAALVAGDTLDMLLELTAPS